MPHNHGGTSAVGGNAEDNPFRMPLDEEVFALRDRERRRKAAMREEMKTLRIHEKTAKTSRLALLRRSLKEEDDEEAAEEAAASMNKSGMLTSGGKGKDGKGGFLPAIPGAGATSDRRAEKEDMWQFVARRREMFIVQHSLGVKREEMRKLEDEALAREAALRHKEKVLEEDAARFEAFLKENDRKAVEAMKRAESESSAKKKKLDEIKRLNAAISQVRSEMSKHDEMLEECMRHKEFLDGLTPQEWFAEQRFIIKMGKVDKRRKDLATLAAQAQEGAGSIGGGIASAAAMAAEAAKKRSGSNTPNTGFSTPALSVASAQGSLAPSPAIQYTEVELESAGKMGIPEALLYSEEFYGAEVVDSELPMYFQSAEELLAIFSAAEERNLFLIQNRQETEEALEALRAKTKDTDERLTRETESLHSQMAHLRSQIAGEEAKAERLRDRARLLASAGQGGEDASAALAAVTKKISAVYQATIGDNDAAISALQMLASIERCLETLFEDISLMPKEYVEMAESVKEKERRNRLREDKIAAQRKAQEDRIQRALQRAKAPVKKRTGKPVMFRSRPEHAKKKEDASENSGQPDDEYAYFFE